MIKIEEKMRERIRTFLPNAMTRALISYRDFSRKQQGKTTGGNENAVKNFKAHHEACKVAIAHVELLLKLARWADLDTPELNDVVLAAIITNAQEEVDKLDMAEDQEEGTEEEEECDE